MNLDGKRYLNFDDDVTTIYGVWDLPMGANDRIYVENEFMQLIGGPEITVSNLDGAFVEREGGIMCQLQESCDQNEYQEGSLIELEIIKQFIVDNNLDEKSAKELLDQHKKDREEYMEERRKNKRLNDYYPAESLPPDSMLVVRTKALIDLQDRILRAKTRKDGPIDSRSETTYLNIIGAMLETFIHQSHGEVDFGSEAKLREFLSEKYIGFRGLTERTLAEKFAAAKRAINEDMD